MSARPGPADGDAEASDALEIDWGADDEGEAAPGTDGADDPLDGDRDPDLDAEPDPEVDLDADAGVEPDLDADADADPDLDSDAGLDTGTGTHERADTADRLAAPAASGRPGARLPEAAAGGPEPTDRDDDAPRWSTRDRTRERELLALVAELEPDDPRRIAARDEIVTMHLPLAAFLARRFRDRGESLDDLTQVATIGLLKAVDRFEPERGVEFSTFATPTVVGEIKRHFRDKGWAIRVPRRLQELRIAISRATAELSQSSGRSPTVAELAAHLGISEEEVLEGLESAQAYATLSLDATVGDGSEEGASLADTLGAHDPKLAEVEARQTVDPLLGSLPPRERRIVQMRFYENMTQAQIAERVGISQMHVSRLLAKSLAQMRTSMTDEQD